MLLSTAVNIVVVAAFIVVTARVLPRMCINSPPPFHTTLAVAVLGTVTIAAVLSHIVGALVAETLARSLMADSGRFVVTSPDAGEQLAYEGAFVVFILLVAPLATFFVARAFTENRSVVGRITVAALVGEIALTCVIVALMRPAWAMALSMSNGSNDEVHPLIDIATTLASTVESIAAFAVVGVLAGVACMISARGPREAKERRALLVTALAAGPAALVLGGAAAPSPDVVSQVLIATTIGVVWLVAVGLGVGARRILVRG